MVTFLTHIVILNREKGSILLYCMYKTFRAQFVQDTSSQSEQVSA